jgi:hypothetical protein
MRKKTTRTNGHRSVPIMEDDFDAVKSISAILGQFAPEDQLRILRWVREKFGLDDSQNEAHSPIILPAQVQAPRRALRNPHEMNRPPLNKIIVQDDDEFGELLGIPADRDVPEPPNADILKPVKETRRLVTVVDEHKGHDGKIVKSTSIVAK